MVPKDTSALARLTRWGERATSTDIAYVIRGGFWLGAGQAVSAAAGLLLTIAFANLATPELFGTYRFVLSLAAIIAIPTLAGINTALMRSTAAGGDALALAIRTKFRWGIAAFVLGMTMAVYYWTQGDASLSTAVVIAAVFVPLMEIGSLYASVLLGRKDFAMNARLDAILNVGALVVVAFALLTTESLLPVMLAYFGFWTFGRSVALYVVRKRYPPERSFAPDALDLGKHLSVIGIIQNIAANIDRILLFHLLGPASVAAYSVALSPVQRFQSFAQLMKPLSIPRLAERTSPMPLRLYWKRLALIEVGLVLAAVVYIIIAPPVFGVLFPDYLEFVRYSQALAVGILGSATFFNSSILIALDARKALYTQSIVANGAQIVLTVLGVSLWGIWGAIAAFVATRLVYLVVGTTSVVLCLKRGSAQKQETP